MGKKAAEGRDISVNSFKKSRTYAEGVGIDLKGGNDAGELFKWFLASVLFGARISE